MTGPREPSPRLQGVLLMAALAWAPAGLAGQEPIVTDRAATLPHSPMLWAGVSDTAGVAKPRPRPGTAQDPGGGLSWRRGLLIGALSGGALGVLAHLAINSVPCDTCEDGSSSAEGTFPEFVLGFSVGGALLGALIGAVF